MTVPPTMTPDEMARELAPLRAVVRRALTGHPFTLDAHGIGVLTDRVTLAVAAHLGRTVVPGPTTAVPDGPLPCASLTPHPAHVWGGGTLYDCPGVPEPEDVLREAAAAVGRSQDAVLCHGCAQPYRFTASGRSCLHAAGCKVSVREAAVPAAGPQEKRCQAQDSRHRAHVWGDGQYRCPGRKGKSRG